MMRYLALAAALCACGPKAERVDSTDAAVPAIDTLKPVTATDTAIAAPATSQTPAQVPTKTSTQTKLGRDSAFSPPKNLPKLDTVPTKRPPA